MVARSNKCHVCIEGLKNLNSSFGPEADLVQAKSKGYLTHPDHNLYIILKKLEHCFGKYCRSNDVFEETFNQFLNVIQQYIFLAIYINLIFLLIYFLII